MRLTNIILILLFLTRSISQTVSHYEAFSDCVVPSGWSTKTITGSYGFDLFNNDQSYGFSKGCMLTYKQTDFSNTSRRTFQLISPEFSLATGVNYYLVFNYRFVRPATAALTLSYDGPKGKVNISIPAANDFLPYYYPISSVNNLPKIKFTFEYDAVGNDLGNQLYVDDILFIADNGDCSRAQNINLDNQTLFGHSMPYTFYLSGGQSCPGEYQSNIWYKYASDYSGLLEINTTAEYNNNLNVYEGLCNNLIPIQCSNADEFGFAGERIELQVQQGKTYYFKISKKINDFGKDNGIHSIQLKKLTASKPKPINDICSQVQDLVLNQDCLKSNNYNAEIGSKIPSSNTRSRADVWYRFTSNDTRPVQFITSSDFAEVIALYKGSCNNLQELQVEDFGNKLSFTPAASTVYFIQVSGYFSSIEGNLCAELTQVNSIKPVNDECLGSVAIPLNASCNEVQFYNNNKSSKKPSCVVYHSPDIWYSFIASAEKEVNILIQAGFIYNWAVYEGPCANLSELYCGNSPDPCDGSIRLKGLTAGKTYYLQIMSSTVPLKAGEGKLCVKIEEPSKSTNYEKLRLSLNTECLHGVLTRVKNYSITGGNPNYSYYGPESTDFFRPGEEISAFAEDVNGCRSFVNTEALCKGGSKCKNSNLDLGLTLDCIKDSIGRQNGEVILNYSGLGGSGAYYYYGTNKGIKLKDGDSYQVILIDSDSCFVIESGKVNCPEFTCAQSNLKISATYDCIDTLLKAKLNLKVSDALGSFTISGNQDGDLLNQNDDFTATVLDQAGCSSQALGKVICDFDSCAYARPDLKVEYKCLIDSNGVRNGKAEMIVIGVSKAGGEQFTGNKPGDILFHGDSFKVVMKDAFGCALIREGVVNCVISQINYQNPDKKFYLYPNPANNHIIVYFEINNFKPIYINLINKEGKLISRNKLVPYHEKNEFKLSLENFNSGIYYVQILEEENTYFLKLIKY